MWTVPCSRQFGKRWEQLGVPDIAGPMLPGYSEQDIRKFLGENYLRVFKMVEK